MNQKEAQNLRDAKARAQRERYLRALFHGKLTQRNMPKVSGFLISNK